MLKSRINSENEVIVEEVEGDIEVAQELKPEYTEVLRALMMCESQGLFPLRSSGNIVLHYNEQGKLVKVVPSQYVKV